MNLKMIVKFKWLLMGVVALLVVGLIIPLVPRKGGRLRVDGLVSLTFFVHDFDGPTNSISITDTNELATLLGAVYLKPKEPCACLHMMSVEFRTLNTDVTASVCDHCLDLKSGSQSGSYYMPEDFWTVMKKKLPHDRF